MGGEVIGRFYFRYLCAAIVTPEAHRVSGKVPTSEQRRALTLISKVYVIFMYLFINVLVF